MSARWPVRKLPSPPRREGEAPAEPSILRGLDLARSSVDRIADTLKSSARCIRAVDACEFTRGRLLAL